MAAVRNGVGRETAHEAIKEHAVGRGAGRCARGRPRTTCFARLAADARLGLDRGPAGRAGRRADRLHRRRRRPGPGCRPPDRGRRGEHPAAAAYSPGAILCETPLLGPCATRWVAQESGHDPATPPPFDLGCRLRAGRRATDRSRRSDRPSGCWVEYSSVAGDVHHNRRRGALRALVTINGAPSRRPTATSLGTTTPLRARTSTSSRRRTAAVATSGSAP